MTGSPEFGTEQVRIIYLRKENIKNETVAVTVSFLRLRCVGDFNPPTKSTGYQLVTLAFAVSGHNVVTPFRCSKIDVRECPSFKELSQFKCNLFPENVQDLACETDK